jgi:hypothetical protein
MFAILLRLFEQVTDFLLNKEKLPLKLDMVGLELPYGTLNIWGGELSSESIYGKNEWKFWGIKSDKMLGWAEIDARAREHGVILGSRQRSYYNDFIRELRGREYRPTPAWVKKLANCAIDAFCYGIMADSGCNWSVLRDIDFSNVTFVKELDKTRLVSIKPRAENKIQHIEINARFKPFFNKYRQLRDWMGVDKRYGIYRYGEKGKLKPTEKRLDAAGRRNRIEYLLGVDIPWVNARDWRWNVSYEYLNASNGDIRMVARVLGNEVDTVRKHYGFADFETSATELTSFYRELTEFARRRVRKSQELIPVKFDEDSPRILTGGCVGQKTEDANLVVGFTEDAPQPSCGVPVTCFMCDKYAIHADEQDFRKILSAKSWLESQGRSVAINEDEFVMKYQPIIERIEEILECAIKLSVETKELVNLTRKQVEAGQYDPYWQAQIDALIDGGFL